MNNEVTTELTLTEELQNDSTDRALDDNQKHRRKPARASDKTVRSIYTKMRVVRTKAFRVKSTTGQINAGKQEQLLFDLGMSTNEDGYLAGFTRSQISVIQHFCSTLTRFYFGIHDQDFPHARTMLCTHFVLCSKKQYRQQRMFQANRPSRTSESSRRGREKNAPPFTKMSPAPRCERRACECQIG